MAAHNIGALEKQDEWIAFLSLLPSSVIFTMFVPIVLELQWQNEPGLEL